VTRIKSLLFVATITCATASAPEARAQGRPAWCGSQASMNLAERTICETRSLWDLDDQLNIIYRGALHSVGAERARLQRSQQDWVRVTRNGCNGDDICLTDVYERRIDVVRRIDNRGHMNPHE
jgi:uncharacterized protein